MSRPEVGVPDEMWRIGREECPRVVSSCREDAIEATGDLRAMLRKHDNVRLLFAPGFFTGKGWVTLQIGVRTAVRISRLHKTQWADYASQQRQHPVRLAAVKNRTYWWFQDQFYSENEGLAGASVYALIVTRQQRQAQRIDR